MIELIALVVLVAFLLRWRNAMEGRVARLEQEVIALRTTLAAAPVMQPELSGPAQVLIEPEPDAPTDQVLAATASDPEAETVAVQEAAPLPAPQAAPSRSLESLLGGNWAVWIGGIALALGGVLMARYAIETGLVSPAVRLALAALFGMLLIALGEAIRRKALPERLAALAASGHAMVPGILTAAGGVSLFASIYAAHQLYGFIGPSLTFIMLAIVALSMLALSLFHGQALAGLGLLGAIATPALVTPGTSGDVAVLMVYVTVVWLGSMVASRISGWLIVPILATLGAGMWIVLGASDTGFASPVLALLVMIAATLVLTPDAPAFGGDPVSLKRQGRGNQVLWLVLSFAAMGAVLGFTSRLALLAGGHLPFEALAIVTFLMLALSRRRDSVAGVMLALPLTVLATVSAFDLYSGQLGISDGSPFHPGTVLVEIIAAIFLAAATASLAGRRQTGRLRERLWALAAVLPLVLIAISYADHGNWITDATHGLAAAVLQVGLLALTAYLLRRRPAGLDLASELILVTGAFLALAFAFFVVVDGLALVLLLALSGFGYFLSVRYRNWRSLPWMMLVATVLIAARIAWDPTIVGADRLGTTPLFNALAPAYGIPAILLIASAWLSRRLHDRKLTAMLDAAAVLMSFLALAVLVRHGMNGGRLDSAVPTLGEQSVYTLLTIGFSGMMMLLDRKNSNPVMIYGSMAAGVISMLMVLNLHFFALNPYLSGELVGRYPLLNLLLPGYLLPGLAYAGLALLARDRRPKPYMAALGVASLLLLLGWLTLSVRQLWQGTSLASWQGFFAGETYSYSVAWLAAGVLLLALGARFRSVSLRYASAAVVLLAVVKVFLVDLSNLEGFLRALSFIGLGFVLIGIGLFYQRILVGSRNSDPA